MNIIYTSRGEEMTDVMKDYIADKLVKFRSQLAKVSKIDVEFISEASHKGTDNDISIEIRMNRLGKFIEVKKQGDDFYKVVDEIEPVLRRQLEKGKPHSKPINLPEIE